MAGRALNPQPVGDSAQASQGTQQRDQQTAEPPAVSREHPRPGGSLRPFLVKLDGAEGSHDNAEADAGRRRPRLPAAGVGCMLDWQLSGRMGHGAAAWLRHRHHSTCRQLTFLESHAWQRAVLGGAPLPPDQAGAIHCATFDGQGELLVTVSGEGLVTVNSTAALLAAAGTAGTLLPPERQHLGTADPLLVLDTHLPKPRAVRWNSANENVVGVVSATTRQLPLYDLQHTQGEPRQVLLVPSASAAGLTDLAFFGAASGSAASGGGYVALASGMGGQLFLWDARAKAAPCATLVAHQYSAANALQLAPDGQVVVAGTQTGEVKLWDLRGGSSSTLRFGGTLHHHPLLASLTLRHALTAVPGLARQTAIPASAIQSMQLDPCDPRRLAFHLGCGWSGVLRFHSGGGGGGGGAGTVSHLHAPAHTYPEAAASHEGGVPRPAEGASVLQMLLWVATAAPALHRRGCWMAGGRRFAVPSRREDALLLLDFADSPAAGCYVLREEEEEEEEADAEDAAAEGSVDASRARSGSGRGSSQQRVPSAVHVPLSQAAVCAAAHPSRDLLVAGGMNSCLSVAGPA